MFGLVLFILIAPVLADTPAGPCEATGLCDWFVWLFKWGIVVIGVILGFCFMLIVFIGLTIVTGNLCTCLFKACARHCCSPRTAHFERMHIDSPRGIAPTRPDEDDDNDTSESASLVRS